MSISRRAAVIFGTTYFAYAGIYFARKPFAVVKGTIETELSFSRDALAAIDSSLLVAYAISQLLLGKTVSFLGQKTPIILAFFIAGAATACVGLMDSSLAMSFFWGTSGFAAAVASPLFCIILADIMPPAIRATAIGAWSSCQQLGGIAANIVSAAVLANYSWRAVFYTSGAIVSMFAPILLLVLPATERAGSSTVAKDKEQAQNGKPSSDTSILQVPGAISVAVSYTLVKMSRYCLMFWLPYFLARHLGMSAAAAGTVSAALDLGGGLGSILGGIACDRFYNGKSLAISFHLALATSLGLLAWTGASAALSPPPMALHVAAILLVGFCIAVPDGVLGGASSRSLVDYAGIVGNGALVATISGVINGCGSVGAVAQGVLTSKIIDHFGWNGLFLSLSGAMLLASLSLLKAVGVEARAVAKSLPSDAKKTD